MKLIILAGGFGSRLRTILGDTPKALAPIGGTPFLELQLQNWRSQGLNDFTFLLHHRAEKIIQFLQIRSADLLNGCKIDWLIEPIPMGTGGAIANAVHTKDIRGNFLVTNADTWLGGGVSKMIKSTAPAIAVVNSDDVSRYGSVSFDEDRCVIAFAEKTNASPPGWINAGLYHLSASLFQGWDGKAFALEHDLFNALVRDGRLGVVPMKADFIDIGVPADYHRFCGWVNAGQRVPLCN